jgi:hypothetical protein
MIVVYHFLQGANAHGASAHVIHATAFVGKSIGSIQIGSRSGVVLGRLSLAQTLLVFDILFLKEQVIVNALKTEMTQFASTGRVNRRQLGCGPRTSSLSLLASDAGGRSRWRLVLRLFLLFIQLR